MITDAWSSALLGVEARALHNAWSRGIPSSLSELVVQYRDYACWRLVRMHSEALQSGLDFWKEVLGDSQPTELPLDHERPERPTGQFDRVAFEFSPELSSRFERLCAGLQSTPFAGLLAGFLTTWHRLTGDVDIVVGGLDSGRSQRVIEPVIGAFVNPVVVRNRVDAQQSFAEFVRQVQSNLLASAQHAWVPFERIVTELRPERITGKSPFFRVQVIGQTAAAAAHNQVNELFGVNAEPLGGALAALQARARPYDMAIDITPRDGRLSIVTHFDADLFTRSTVERIADGFEATVAALTDQSTQAMSVAVADLPHLRPAVVIGGTFDCGNVESPVRFWVDKLGMAHGVQCVAPREFSKLLTSPRGALRLNPGTNVLLVRPFDWLVKGSIDAVRSALDQRADVLVQALASAAKSSVGQLLVTLVPPPTHELYAERAAALSTALSEVAARVLQSLTAMVGVDVMDWAEMERVYDVATRYIEGQSRLTPQAYAGLATNIVREAWSLGNANYELVILDGDNTLWPGVAGAAGTPSPQALSPQYVELQTFMADLAESGMQLAATNVGPRGVSGALDASSDMPLRPSHISAERWGDEAITQQVRAIGAELGVEMSKVIVVSGDPVHCSQARQAFPEAFVLELPADPHRMTALLKHTWVLRPPR